MRPHSIAQQVTPPHKAFQTAPTHMHVSVHIERHPLAEILANKCRRLPASHCTSAQLQSPLTPTRNKTVPIHKQVYVQISRNPLAERLVNDLRLPASDIICSTCNHTFTNKYNLRRHERNIHQPRQKNDLRCRLCQKTFARYDSLQRHLKFHRGERSHHCSICHKTFVTSACLKRHLNSKIHNRQRSIM